MASQACRQTAKGSGTRRADCRSGQTVPPYTGLARIYDRVMGDAIFPIIRDSFDRAVARFGIHFRSAADVGCGTGTFVRHIADCGVAVYGVDSSPSMLLKAAEKNRGNGVRLVRGSMEALRLPQRVDLITCNYDTLNYFTSLRALFRVLTSLHANLRPGGHLLFDVIVHTGNGRPCKFIQRIKVPEGFAVWTEHLDPIRGISLVEMRSWFRTRTGLLREEREIHRQRWYPLASLYRLSRAAGYKVLGVYDVNGAAPASASSTWVKFITWKPVQAGMKFGMGG